MPTLLLCKVDITASDKVDIAIYLRHRGIRHLQHRLTTDKAKDIRCHIARALEEAEVSEGKIRQLNLVDTQFKVPDEVVGTRSCREDIGSGTAKERIEP